MQRVPAPKSKFKKTKWTLERELYAGFLGSRFDNFIGKNSKKFSFKFGIWTRVNIPKKIKKREL